MESFKDLQVSAKSGNGKTGPIPVTYRPERTCEPTCPLLGAGCYGTGRIFAMADKYSRTMTREEVTAKLRERPKNPTRKVLPIVRDRVVGDVVTVGADGAIVFDIDYVESIADVVTAENLTPFGYSHAWRRMTADDVDRTRASGYVLNASCETVGDVEEAIGMGLPATVANDDIAEGTMIAGKRVVTCPAQTRENVDCASCGLCAKPDRKAVIRFEIHGTAKRKAQASVARRVAEDDAR